MTNGIGARIASIVYREWICERGITTLRNIVANGSAFLYPRIVRSLKQASVLLVRFFPLAVVGICIALLIYMERLYEQGYDAQYHQGWVETVTRWKSFSLDLGGHPTRSFGIQPLTNPMLSPTFLIGSLVSADLRIPVQAAFQAVVLLLVLAALARAGGARREEAYAIALIAQAYSWDPLLSWYAFPLNATLGLFWQESAIAVLLAFCCFLDIGRKPQGRPPWAAVSLAALLLWFLLALPYQIPYFTLAVISLCVGSLLAVESLRELIHKLVASLIILSVFLALGAHNYVLGIFMYTPQIFYRTLYNYDFHSLFFTNTSFLLSANQLGGWYVYTFFLFALIGGVSSLAFGNRTARRIVFAAIGLEVLIHCMSAVNAVFAIVPLTFTYVEQVGFPIITLMAGVGVWTLLRLAGVAAEWAAGAIVDAWEERNGLRWWDRRA